MPATAEFSAAALWNTLARALGLTVLVVGAVLALVFAFAAALVVGLMVAGAALALRLFPGKRSARSADDVLEAHRTPDGWVVEARAQRKS